MDHCFIEPVFLCPLIFKMLSLFSHCCEPSGLLLKVLLRVYYTLMIDYKSELQLGIGIDPRKAQNINISQYYIKGFQLVFVR